MEEILQFLIRHGYLFLFLFVVAEQIGLPMPALPVLLAAGALARAGHLNWAVMVAVAVAASLLSDWLWYEVGRRKGGAVIKQLCRLALEPDSCSRKTEELFYRYGAFSLVIAKFVPGLNTAAPPLAGTLGMRWPRFLLFDTIGSLLWVVLFTGIGYVFSDQLEEVVRRVTGFGGLFFAVAVGGLGLYVLVKYVHRQRVLHELRLARITPDELRAQLDAGQPVVLVDLRHRVDQQSDPHTIPGAIAMPAEEIGRLRERLPPQGEVVLFCT